jgi:hypothetical protein
VVQLPIAPPDTTDAERLKQLELLAVSALSTAYDTVGAVLREIRDNKLYKETHKSFEAYCKERWGFTRQTAYDYIKAEGVVRALRFDGVEAPSSIREALRHVEPKPALEPEIGYDEEQDNVLDALVWLFRNLARLALVVTPRMSRSKLKGDSGFRRFDLSLQGLTQQQVYIVAAALSPHGRSMGEQLESLVID